MADRRRWWYATCPDCLRTVTLTASLIRGLVLADHIAHADIDKVEILICPGSGMPPEDVTVHLRSAS